MRRFINFVAILVAILAIFPLYTHYKAVAAPIPPGVYLGGLDLSDLKNTNDIRQHLQQVYDQPIAVRFGDQQLALRPQDVDFQIDADQMIAEAGRYLNGSAFLDIAAREALGFTQKRRDVPVRFTMNGQKVRAWLQNVATQYNHGPQPARVLPPAPNWAEGGSPAAGLPPGFVGAYDRDWLWMPGSPGYTLDVDASVPVIAAALTNEHKRVADLVLQETPPPPPSMSDLQQALNDYLSNFPGFAAVYVHDLRTDEEATVDADVSFSGMSTLKIGIATALMHLLKNGIEADNPKVDQVGQWLDLALGESNNQAANLVLTYLGGGDIFAGTRRFTEFMRSLGFKNTYMQSGYEAKTQLPEIPTPGNQRTDWNTDPDTNLQSSPADMGRILSAVYECTQGKGLLMERYPNDFTPDECRTILFYMTHDEFQELIWAGLPRPWDAWIVHKHGFAFESHSDVALVWGPTGPYVLSIFLYRKGWMDWATSNGTMKTISRITWNFFAFRQKQLGIKTPPPPFTLSPPPGYSKIKDYIPVASRAFQK